MIYYTLMESPLDQLLLVSDGEALTGLFMALHKHGPDVRPEWRREDELPLFAKVVDQLRAYFRGQAARVRSPAEGHRHTISTDRLGRAPQDPIRRDDLIRRTGEAHRVAGLIEGRRSC